MIFWPSFQQLEEVGIKLSPLLDVFWISFMSSTQCKPLPTEKADATKNYHKRFLFSAFCWAWAELNIAPTSVCVLGIYRTYSTAFWWQTELWCISNFNNDFFQLEKPTLINVLPVISKPRLSATQTQNSFTTLLIVQPHENLLCHDAWNHLCWLPKVPHGKWQNWLIWWLWNQRWSAQNRRWNSDNNDCPAASCRVFCTALQLVPAAQQSQYRLSLPNVC